MKRHLKGAVPANQVSLNQPRRPGALEMNALERDFELYLRSRDDVTWFAFALLNIRLADATNYRPDFAAQVRGSGYLHLFEVKGSWRAPHQADSRVKLKVAAEQCPQFVFWSATRSRKTDPWMLEAIPSSAAAVYRRGRGLGPVPDPLDSAAIAAISASDSGGNSGGGGAGSAGTPGLFGTGTEGRMPT